MSTVGTITKAAGTVVGRTVHTVTHPLESAAFAVGLVRGAATAAGDVISRRGEPSEADEPSPAAETSPATEPVVTEPVATESEAPAPGAEPSAPVDEPRDAGPPEVPSGPDVETPVGTTGAGTGYNPDTGETDLQQPGTEPLMDPSLTKAVKSEAETLGKAAEPTKE